MEINTGSYITLESNEEMLRLVHYTLNDISQMMCISTLYYVESLDDDNTVLMAIKSKANDTYKYLVVPTSIVRECYMPVKVDGTLKKYVDALMSKHIGEELEEYEKYGENEILVWKEKAKKWDNRGEVIAMECYRQVQKERDEYEQKAKKYDELELNGDIAYIESKVDRHNSFVKLKKERDEALKRVEELEKELVNPNRIVSIKPHSWGEYEERIEELEQKNKVLVDGMMALSFLFTDLDFAMLETYIRNPKLLDRWLENGTITRDQYIKIKALLELLENIL